MLQVDMPHKSRPLKAPWRFYDQKSWKCRFVRNCKKALSSRRCRFLRHGICRLSSGPSVCRTSRSGSRRGWMVTSRRRSSTRFSVSTARLPHSTDGDRLREEVRRFVVHEQPYAPESLLNELVEQRYQKRLRGRFLASIAPRTLKTRPLLHTLGSKSTTRHNQSLPRWCERCI